MILPTNPARLADQHITPSFQGGLSPLKLPISTPTVNPFPAFLSATSGGLSVHAICAVSLSLRVEGHLPYLSRTDKVLDKTGEHC